MATVVFTPAAEREVDDLHAWISQRAGERIAEERGRKRDDLLPGLRTIGFERSVTIAFVIDGDLVSIEGVFYGGRDFERKTSVNE
jgi:toxin ParE1/3/4